MTAGRYDIEIEQGATWLRTITVEDPNGEPINLTGYSARMQVRIGYDATSAILTLTSPDGGISIDPLTGTLSLTASATQTAAMPAGIHVYDLELVIGTTVDRLVAGRARVYPEATR